MRPCLGVEHLPFRDKAPAVRLAVHDDDQEAIMFSSLRSVSMDKASSFTASLLPRSPRVIIGDEAHTLIEDRTILVTGAGGSIGSELARQLSQLRPRRVYLLDHDESALHAMQLEFHGHGLFADDTSVLCDIRDSDALRRVFARVRPDLVFHAAAHKHLPPLERYPAEGVKTNVIGTDNVVRAAVEAGVSRLVNVSTDKAARPVSVLGATKRLAEILVAGQAEGATRAASVRFGNVLGSRGSFLHSLAWQLDRGLPVTVTDPGVTRYFMTIPEAAGLVIEAAVMADAGETFVLDMGAPIQILDLINRFVALRGDSPPTIVFTGLRPGEKLHEELFDDAEVRTETTHRRITSVAQLDDHAPEVSLYLEPLACAAADSDDDKLRRLIWALLPAGKGRSGSATGHHVELTVAR